MTQQLTTSDALMDMIARTSRLIYERDTWTRWRDSPWGWMRELSPVAKSQAGMGMLAQLLNESGIPARATIEHFSATIILPNGHTARVKTSMAWYGATTDPLPEFHFQQIRDGDYSTLLLFGLEPTLAQLWVVPRVQALGRSVPMHSEQSRKITFKIGQYPEWLLSHGGSLERGIQIVRRRTATPPL